MMGLAHYQASRCPTLQTERQTSISPVALSLIPQTSACGPVECVYRLVNIALEKALRRHVMFRTETAIELWRDLNSPEAAGAQADSETSA
jgi:hypothetical protein